MIETGRSMVDVERLLLLQPLGFDVLYLVLGERAKEVAATLLDWGLVSKILAGIRNGSGSHGLVLPVEKEVLILKLLYERFARDGVVDDLKLQETLRIAV